MKKEYVMSEEVKATIENLRAFTAGKKYNTIYADPPWQFQNRTGKVAPEHKRLNRYPTMGLEDICSLPVEEIADTKAHLYLWVPNALLPDGLKVMDRWGFEYKGNLVWEKVRKDGEPDGRGVGFYFRNVTELLLFGIKKKSEPNRTLAPLNGAHKVQGLSSLHAATEKAGICGATRRLRIMSRHGAPTRTTQ